MELATVAPMPELPRVSAPARPSLSGTVARADAEFNAEASAFFDEDDLGVTGNPPTLAAINRGPSLEPADAEFDDEATTKFVTPPRALPDDFGDAETLLPGAAMVDEGGGAPNDVSLDEFMRTDSFDVPEPAFADDGDEQATLLPEQVRRAAQPDIEDVFDITAEGTIPPVRSGRGSSSDDDDDDDDAPTQIQTR